jgi:LacI family transcriptional regulator
MATMHDVARRAKVSIATVSAVLNRSCYVSPELTARVEKAADFLDYRINTLARSLKSGSTRTIGMLIPSFGSPDPFFSDVVQGAEVGLRAASYSLLLGQTHNKVEEQSEHIAAFRARLVDGLLLFQAPGEDDELNKLMGEKKPVVFVGRVPHNQFADVVATDIENGTWLGCRHLLERGKRRIGLVCQKDSMSVRDFRLEGWRRAHREAGVTPLSALQVEGELSTDGGFEATMRLLDRKQLPDAIFVDDLVLTIGVVRALQAKDLVGQIEVLSSDDAEWLDVFHLPITTIVQPSQAVGREAARLLLARLQEPERPAERILLKPELKIR